MRIGLISDTHGMLRPEALAFLQGCEYILHAGDIGDPGILERLAALAPLTAVRGNNDRGPWAEALPEVAHVEAGGVLVAVIHDLAALSRDTLRPGVQVVVSGHSHVPKVSERGGILYVNPGSAGARRFSLPVSIGELRAEDGRAEARVVTLAAPGSPSRRHRTG